MNPHIETGQTMGANLATTKGTDQSPANEKTLRPEHSQFPAKDRGELQQSIGLGRLPDSFNNNGSTNSTSSNNAPNRFFLQRGEALLNQLRTSSDVSISPSHLGAAPLLTTLADQLKEKHPQIFESSLTTQGVFAKIATTYAIQKSASGFSWNKQRRNSSIWR